MKVLLVSINSKYVHSCLAAWYLKAAAEKYADIDILESTIKADLAKLLQNILSYNADVVAFSCYIWNISFLENLFEPLKSARPTQTILLGGPEVSYRANEIFSKFPMVDYIISGEGEEPFCQFLQQYHTAEFIKPIAGLCKKNDISAPYISEKDPKTPYTHEYFKALAGRIAYIETSRGCPFSCSYCLSGRIGNVRFFDINRVKTELSLLANSGTQTIKFVDRTFNCNTQRALTIIRYLLKENPTYRGVCYHFEMAGDLISEEMLHVLNTAPKGLFQIEVGVQSFNETTLCAVNRKTNLINVRSNLHNIIKNNNIHVHVDLIAGLPFEDFASFRYGFNQLFTLRPHQLQLGFLKRLHGSPLEKQEVGVFSQKAPYQVIDTPWMSQKELVSLQKTEDAVDRLYNSGRFKNLVFAALDTGISAFDLFFDFGHKNEAHFGEPLEKYAEKVLNYFSKLLGEQATRDLMKEQWLKTNSSGNMLFCLKDTSQKGLLKRLDSVEKRKPGVKRSAAVLYGSQEIIYVDYTHFDPVLKEYPLKRTPFF